MASYSLNSLVRVKLLCKRSGVRVIGWGRHKRGGIFSKKCFNLNLIKKVL